MTLANRITIVGVVVGVVSVGVVGRRAWLVFEAGPPAAACLVVEAGDVLGAGAADWASHEPSGRVGLHSGRRAAFPASLGSSASDEVLELELSLLRDTLEAFFFGCGTVVGGVVDVVGARLCSGMGAADCVCWPIAPSRSGCVSDRSPIQEASSRSRRRAGLAEGLP